MPPKKSAQPVAAQSKPQKKGKSGKSGDDAMLDQLVRAIEGKTNDMLTAKKAGMTKQQLEALQERGVVDVLRKLQPNSGHGATVTRQQLEKVLQQQQLMKEQAIRDAQYVNVPVPLKSSETEWFEVSENKYIRYEQFEGTEDQMDFIVNLFTAELTEPYSSFTYQYFVYGWPDLSIIAYGVESKEKPDASVIGDRVGAVVSRVTRKGPGHALRGYVAMFAVVPKFRGFRLGSKLVTLTIQLMKEKGCDEVYLETPTYNERALSLYTSLGFAKTKFLPWYYLDGSDAVRLKIWLKDAAATVASAAQQAAAAQTQGAAEGAIEEAKDTDAATAAQNNSGPVVEPPE